ncbi:MAG TPA: hypothetical protein VGX91_00875 [Candidatus Cybelea sp.]|nr:hypothetical protein [Candidatus Cybelea sp.]
MMLAALVAVTIPSPSPSPGERELPTIVTVISSPYCNSLADHFNGAMLPMLANDRVLDQTSVQLDNINSLFDYPNFTQRFLQTRDQIGKEEVTLNKSLSNIAHNIADLRAGAALSTDAQAKATVEQASWELQAAYDHQRQVAIDLQDMYWTMMNYKIWRANPALGGFDQREMEQPPEMRDVKSYLHFNAQRATIDQNEDKAVDVAYTAAQTYCTPKK